MNPSILNWDDNIYLIGYYLRHNFGMLDTKKCTEKKVKEILWDEFEITDEKFIRDLMSHMTDCLK